MGEDSSYSSCTATFYGKAHRAVFLTHLLSTDSIFLSTCIDIILTPTLCTIYACHAPLYTFANKYMIRAACLRKLLTDQSETFCPCSRFLSSAAFFLPISRSLRPSDASLPCAKPTLRILSRWIRVNLENFRPD